MHEPSERMNDAPGAAEIERQLQSLEPLPPQIDRDALMYRAGWAAALAQQPTMRRAWLAPAFGGALAATAAGILALALWRPNIYEPSNHPVAQIRGKNTMVDPPRADRRTSGQVPADDPESREHDRVENAPPATAFGGFRQPQAREHEQVFIADAPAPTKGASDPWGIVSTALAKRHGVLWDEAWQQNKLADNAMPANPPPTVMHLMRAMGVQPERRQDAPPLPPPLPFIDRT